MLGSAVEEALLLEFRKQHVCRWITKFKKSVVHDFSSTDELVALRFADDAIRTTAQCLRFKQRYIPVAEVSPITRHRLLAVIG